MTALDESAKDESAKDQTGDRYTSPPAPKSISPEQCAAELMETIPLVTQFMRAEMRSQSAALLSVPQFRVLNYLRRHPDASLSEVAEHIGVTRATASAMTERLVQRGFISRVVHPQERRHVMLNLTEMGTAHLQQSREMTLNKIATLLHSLTDEQIASVAVGMATLHRVFDGAIASPPSEIL